jgi:pimeloyl-ACP methyl ester carboxylesterase
VFIGVQNKMHTIKYPFDVKKINIHEGIDIAYCDEGSGDTTLLFIHGLANYLPVWKHQVNFFKKDYRCIALDLPGNGFSSRGELPYTMFFYAECIIKFIEKLELKNAILCGHSMGGQISMIISLRYPQLIDKLILIAPAGLEVFTQHEILLMQQAMNFGDFFYSDEYHLESTIKQSFFNTKNESSNIIHDLKNILKNNKIKEWKEMSISSINGMLNEQVNKFLHTISTPTFIIFGNKDQLIPNKLIHFNETPESIAEKATAVIPNSSYKIIKDAGHFVQIEKHMEVNNAITDWLSIKK